jgi:hypothetical protein
MTKKDYIIIAHAINNVGKNTPIQKKQQWQAIMNVVIELGRVLKEDNQKFDYQRFVHDCNN